MATVVLALVRCIFPEVAGQSYSDNALTDSLSVDTTEVLFSDDTLAVVSASDSLVSSMQAEAKKRAEDSIQLSTEKLSNQPAVVVTGMGRFFDGKHPILSVPSFREEFADSQQVQIIAANTFGVQAVQNREDAEQRKGELVYVGSNPYYYVKELTASIPYLVPRAAVLLQDIGRNFFDSLQVKRVPLHKIMVTSVLRSKDDVARLRTHNHNATENSCHLYGTTFDIGYNHYQTVRSRSGQPRRDVQSDTLKYILAEVLRDLRNQNRCYVKYEVQQSCFHITVR